jgi:hypothetical protein
VGGQPLGGADARIRVFLDDLGSLVRGHVQDETDSGGSLTEQHGSYFSGLSQRF